VKEQVAVQRDRFASFRLLKWIVEVLERSSSWQAGVVPVRGGFGPILDLISACRTRRFCGRLSTTSCDCDHNGHSQY
jgi:hypothetical protein